jgi:hypothetical protein
MSGRFHNRLTTPLSFHLGLFGVVTAIFSPRMPSLSAREAFERSLITYGHCTQQLLYSILENDAHDLYYDGDDEDNHAGLVDVDIVCSEILEDMALFDHSTAVYELLMSRMARSRSFLNLIQHVRVLFPLDEVPKSSQIPLTLYDYRHGHPKQFRRNLRVSPETFDSLVDHIEHDPIFHSNSFNQQLPVTAQLAIVLYRFGHFGNASSVEQVAQWAGCSAGCVVKCTQRVIIALTGLRDEAFQVTEPMKAAAKAWVASASCREWRNGWCMADGTLVPLADKPGHHGEAYYDRKGHYSLNVLVGTNDYTLQCYTNLLSRL